MFNIANIGTYNTRPNIINILLQRGNTRIFEHFYLNDENAQVRDGFGARPGAVGGADNDGRAEACRSNQIREIVFQSTEGTNTGGTGCGAEPVNGVRYVSAHLNHHATGCNGAAVKNANYFAAKVATNAIMENCENRLLNQRENNGYNFSMIPMQPLDWTTGHNALGWGCGYIDSTNFNMATPFAFTGINHPTMNNDALHEAMTACPREGILFGSGVIRYYKGVMVKHLELVGGDEQIEMRCILPTIDDDHRITLEEGNFGDSDIGVYEGVGLICTITIDRNGNATAVIGNGHPVGGGVNNIGLPVVGARDLQEEQEVDKILDDGSISEPLDNTGVCDNPITFQYDGYI